MITPAFNLTATERVLPRLAFDFTTAILDSRITFTRALNTATAVNSLGYVATVNADTARFDYNPVTLACKGLLIEEARTNLLTYSEDYSQAVWTLNAGMTIDATYQSPSNSMTANRIKERTTASATNAIVYASGPTITADSTITMSAFIKAVPGEAQRYVRMTVSSNSGTNGFRALFNPNTGANSLAGAAFGTGTFTSATTTSYGNGWYRVTITGKVDPAATTLTQVGIFLQNQTVSYGALYTGNGTAGVILWGMMLEAGAFATSYIPTDATAVTRNADVATMTGANFSDWFNASEGSAVIQAIPSTISGTRPAVEFDDNTANESIALRSVAADPQLFVVDSGATQATLDAGTITANTVYKLGGAWKDSSFAVAINGAAAVSQASGTYPTVTQARLGSDGTNYLNGWLQNLRYWPQRIVNAEVQAFSK